MCVDEQIDSLARTIRAVVSGDTRHDAAVSFAISCIFLEGDVTVAAAIVGDKKDVILSYLSIHHVSILIMPCVKTTVMKVAGGIEIGV